MRHVHIRRATSTDAEAVRAVGHATWPTTYAFAGPEHVADGLRRWWSPEAVEQSIVSTETFVAEVDGEVVGMGNLDLRTGQPTIWKLYVLPSSHGSGVGSALMEALVDAVPPESTAVVLEYLDGNDRAARFYDRHGFTELRRERSETPGEPDTVWLQRLLRAPE